MNSVGNLIGVSIIILIYLCIAVILFAPSIYVISIYVIGRKAKLKKQGNLKVVLSTCCINLLIVYLLYQIAFHAIVPQKVAEYDELVRKSVKSAAQAEELNFQKTGTSYDIGPFKGPLNDKNGLVIEKDVILRTDPEWDKNSNKQTFVTLALHLWGDIVMRSVQGGPIERISSKDQTGSQLRSKLLNSVK